MCRNIKRLYNMAPPATEAEVRASALQYVRKVSGMAKPSQANTAAIDAAVDEGTTITLRLLFEELETKAAPRDRAVEAERARARGQQREARMRAKVLAELGDSAG